MIKSQKFVNNKDSQHDFKHFDHIFNTKTQDFYEKSDQKTKKNKNTQEHKKIQIFFF